MLNIGSKKSLVLNSGPGDPQHILHLSLIWLTQFSPSIFMFMSSWSESGLFNNGDIQNVKCSGSLGLDSRTSTVHNENTTTYHKNISRMIPIITTHHICIQWLRRFFWWAGYERHKKMTLRLVFTCNCSPREEAQRLVVDCMPVVSGSVKMMKLHTAHRLALRLPGAKGDVNFRLYKSKIDEIWGHSSPAMA